MSDSVSTAFGATKGVVVAVGKSRTIDLDLFSSAPTSGPWMVDVKQLSGSFSSPTATFALDRNQGLNGDTLKLTITAVTSSSSSRLGGTSFLVTSTLGTSKTYWAGIVANE
jgi:hypothetical protein